MSNHGYATEVELLPQGAHGFAEIGRKPVARITLHPNALERDDLGDAIHLRQTNRKPFTGPLISSEEAEKIESLISHDDVHLSILRQPEQCDPSSTSFTGHGKSRSTRITSLMKRACGSATVSRSDGLDVTV